MQLELREYQVATKERVVSLYEQNARGKAKFVWATGCHRAGQGILMHDGAIKPVEEIKIGDLVMGSDSTARQVLFLHQGQDQMIEICPVKGNSRVVNTGHILTLVQTNKRTIRPSAKDGTVQDVQITDWFNWSATQKHLHKLFRVSVDFPQHTIPLPVHPYLIGALLGDGGLTNEDSIHFTNIDEPVVREVERIVQTYNLRLHPMKCGNRTQTYAISGKTGRSAHFVKDGLRALKLFPIRCEGRFIPHEYKTASRKDRLELLAGLIDTDGHYNHGRFEFCSKSQQLANDVMFVVRSLGLAAYKSPKEINGTTYYCVSISGDCSIVPTRIPRKQSSVRLQKKDVLRTRFTCKPTGTIENYYGFTVDGDNRYLLDDFTVTHNCGKTVGFSAIAHEIQKRTGINVLIIAHRDELLTQAAQKYRYIDPDAHIGKVGGGSQEWGHPVTVASIQTIARPQHLKNLKHFGFGLVIIDECFPSGTLIDGKPIEQIRAGDMVTAFDEKTGSLIKSRVVRTFCNPAKQLLRITAGLQTVVCTPNHPFYTSFGWRTAAQLFPNEEILYAGDHSELYTVPSAIHAEPQSTAERQAKQERLLFRDMSTKTVIRDNGKNQQETCLATHDNQQSNEQGNQQKQNASDAQNDWTQTQNTGRQWERPNTSTADASQQVAMEDGTCHHNNTTAENDTANTQLLQNRHSQSLAHDSDRNRRNVSHDTQTQSPGQEERASTQWVRVDCIEVLEPGCDGTFGGLYPDNSVYNFEVEHYHTYTANGFVVHNCHHAHAGNEYGKVLNELPEAFRIGCTATDDRLDRLQNDDLFGESVLTVSILDAIEQGFLTNVRAIAIRTGTSLDGLHSREGDYQVKELSEKINTPSRNKKIVDAYLQHASDRQAMAFTVDIAHATDLAHAFTEQGVAAVAVSGKTHKRGQILRDFEQGKYRVLCNCQVFTEGYDAETTFVEDEDRYIFLSCAIMARPTKSRGLFVQCIGRILRLAPTKKDALILDATDNILNHRLEPQSLAKVVGVQLEDGESVTEAKERKENTEREKRERKTKVSRSQDVVIDVLARLDWHQRDDGMYTLEVGPLRHKIAIVADTDDDDQPTGYYTVWARLAPFYDAQMWAEDVPLDMAQSLAEKKARLLISDVNNIKLIDRNAPWRRYPASEKQIEMLKRFGIPLELDEFNEPIITKGEAADILDPIFEKLKQKNGQRVAV